MPQILALDHVQLAMPKGGEEDARYFFVKLLGFNEVEKPANMAKRGGCWFEIGPVQLHLGVEQLFKPAKKSHPAFEVDDVDGFAQKLERAGYKVKWNEEMADVKRFFTEDPFGNRIEILELI